MSATSDVEAALQLGLFIDRCPTPFHVVQTCAERLSDAGFVRLLPTEPFGVSGEVPQRAFVVRDGSLIAFCGVPGASRSPIRLIGAHTDSPNLRIRPRPDTGAAGFRQLSVEVYGGALLNSWLDRDLTLAGRVAVTGTTELDRAAGRSTSQRLFHHRGALLRVPQLAVHLDREANEGLSLDRQRHLQPVWALGTASEGDFRSFVAGQVGVPVEDVLGWDVACADTQPCELLGVDREMLVAPRLDNLCSCYAAVEALSAADPSTGPSVVALFDHEEVGSTSTTGALGAWLAQVLERAATAGGGDRTMLLEAIAGSMAVSADMAHATHPNYPERHEPGHWIRLGGGPVIKQNSNMRYATDSRSAAEFRLTCAVAGLEVQDYSHRGDLACGSTIGPLVAAGLALDTVDVGMAQLSMHSAREVMAVADVARIIEALSAWLQRRGAGP